MFRSGTYWACVCQIAVTPSTGAIVVEKYAIAVDPGIVVNPAQLKRQVEGGAVMGISHALYEEAMFDESGITSRDWNTYPSQKWRTLPKSKSSSSIIPRSAHTAVAPKPPTPSPHQPSPPLSTTPPAKSFAASPKNAPTSKPC